MKRSKGWTSHIWGDHWLVTHTIVRKWILHDMGPLICLLCFLSYRLFFFFFAFISPLHISVISQRGVFLSYHSLFSASYPPQPHTPFTCRVLVARSCHSPPRGDWGYAMALAGCPDYFLHHSNYQVTLLCAVRVLVQVGWCIAIMSRACYLNAPFMKFKKKNHGHSSVFVQHL